jgi:prophage antirepressor-like protein
MNNNLVPFKFESNEIRIVMVNNEPWAIIADIAKAIEYANPSDLVKLADKDDLEKVEVIDSIGRKQHCKRHKPLNLLNSVNLTESLSPKLLMIQEPDVYRLIVKSTLPAAEAA